MAAKWAKWNRKRRARQESPQPRTTYAAYMRSEGWKIKKAEAFLYHGRYCKRCGSPNHLEVHHNYYGRLGKELMSDLEILCSDCHELHHMQDRAWRGRHRR